MYICIDGIDGSGKSTLANNLAEILNCEIFETGLDDDFGIDVDLYNEIKKNYFKSIRYNIDGVLWFYLLKMFSFENKICENDILCVRSFVSLMGYLGDNEKIFNLANKIFTKPMLTILLKPKYDEVCRRLECRNSTDEIVARELYDAFYLRIINGLKRYNFNYIVIDNTYLNEVECSKLVKELIDNEKIKYL